MVFDKVVNFRLFHIIPSNIKISNNLEIDYSAITVSSGYFIGIKNMKKIIFGSIYSLIILLVFNSQNYSEHLQNPYIYSVIIGFSITQGIYTLIEYFKSKELFQYNKGLHIFNSNKKSVLLIALYIIFCVFIFSGKIVNSFKLSIWIFLLVIPFSLILSVSTISGIAETGFWLSVIDDLLPILIILLSSSKNILSVISLVCVLSLAEVCGIYYIINKRVSTEFSIKKNKIIELSIFSNIFGLIIGIILIHTFSQSNIFLTNQLPVPLSQIFALQISTIFSSLSELQIPETINLYIFVISCIIGIILYKKNISPMIILSGIILPFGTILLLLIGVSISWVRKNDKLNDIFCGLSIGDGVISSLAAFLKK